MAFTDPITAGGQFLREVWGGILDGPQVALSEAGQLLFRVGDSIKAALTAFRGPGLPGVGAPPPIGWDTNVASLHMDNGGATFKFYDDDPATGARAGFQAPALFTAEGSVPALLGESGGPGLNRRHYWQAGQVTPTTDANGFAQVAFPTPFPTGLLSLQLTPAENPNQGDQYTLADGTFGVAVSDRTTMRWRCMTAAGVARGGVPLLAHYLAVGW